VKWQDLVKNIDIAHRFGLLNIADIISKRCGAKHCLVTLLDWMPLHPHTKRYVRSLQ